MRPWTEPIIEDIFTDFSVSSIFDVDIKKLQEESYDMEKIVPNQTRSNIGGYQSDIFYDEDYHNFCESLRDMFQEYCKLKDIVLEYSTDVLQKLRVVNNHYVGDVAWWVNKNIYQSYNQIHNHGRADLIGIFYTKSPKDSSSLVVTRNDGSSYTKLYRENLTMGYSQLLRYPPEEGRFYLFPGHLWHYVLPQEVDEDRISTSYNMYVKSL